MQDLWQRGKNAIGINVTRRSSRFTALLSSLMRMVMNNVTTSTRFLRGGCDS